jgi:hypothetical protein
MVIIKLIKDYISDAIQQLQQQECQIIYITYPDLLKQRRNKVLRIANQSAREGDTFNATRAMFIIQAIDNTTIEIKDKRKHYDNDKRKIESEKEKRGHNTGCLYLQTGR